MEQTAFDVSGFEAPKVEAPDLDTYDKILVGFSGGKDSLACVLHLLDQGVAPERIELWHHEVDGREGNGFLFDWPVTPSYCRAFAEAFSLDIFFSWKEHGFEGEMRREDAPTAPTCFETPDGVQKTGGRGPVGTRRKFPAVTASLNTRWCSSYLKISPGEAAIRNQARFLGKRLLFVTGERGEESKQRSQYAPFEPHRSDNRAGRPSSRRHVDHWRPVLYWREEEVWGIIERHQVMPHPAYFLGISRTSCAFCIFGGSKQFRTARDVLPDQFERIASIEEEFGHTMKHGCTVRELTDDAAPYEAAVDNPMAQVAAGDTFDLPIIVDDWRLPAGAFGNSSGPT